MNGQNGQNENTFKKAAATMFTQFMQQNPQSYYAMKGLWQDFEMVMQKFGVDGAVLPEQKQEVIDGTV